MRQLQQFAWRARRFENRIGRDPALRHQPIAHPAVFRRRKHVRADVAGVARGVHHQSVHVAIILLRGARAGKPPAVGRHAGTPVESSDAFHPARRRASGVRDRRLPRTGARARTPPEAGAGPRLALEIAAIALLLAAVLFWQVRVPLDGWAHHHGPLAAAGMAAALFTLVAALCAWLTCVRLRGALAGARERPSGWRCRVSRR